MKMKKQLLAGALALGLGIGATSLPQGTVAYPTAQVGHTVTMFTLSMARNLARFQRDSAGCYPWTLSVHCTGTPSILPQQGGALSRLLRSAFGPR